MERRQGKLRSTIVSVKIMNSMNIRLENDYQRPQLTSEEDFGTYRQTFKSSFQKKFSVKNKSLFSFSSLLSKASTLFQSQQSNLGIYIEESNIDLLIQNVNRQLCVRESSTSKWKCWRKFFLKIIIYTFLVAELITTHLYAYNYFTVSKVFEKDQYLYRYLYIISSLLAIFSQIIIINYSYIRLKNQFNTFQFLIYSLYGILNYLKILPFIFFLQRNKSNQQYSSSQVDKFLKINKDTYQKNPTILYKQQQKPVNIFRDFIFLRTLLMSQIITLVFQTIPQIIIQGFYNQLVIQKWMIINQFCFIILLVSFLIGVLEVRFIFQILSKRHSFLNQNILMDRIQVKDTKEASSLVKADPQILQTIKQYYIHIDFCNIRNLEAEISLLKIIKFLTRQTKLEYLEIVYLDNLSEYLIKCFKNSLQFLKIDQIRILYLSEQGYDKFQSTFLNTPNITQGIYKDEINKDIQTKTQFGIDINEILHNNFLNKRQELIQQKQLRQSIKVSKEYNQLTLDQKEQEIQISSYYSEERNRLSINRGTEQFCKHDSQALYNRQERVRTHFFCHPCFQYLIFFTEFSLNLFTTGIQVCQIWFIHSDFVLFFIIISGTILILQTYQFLTLYIHANTQLNSISQIFLIPLYMVLNFIRFPQGIILYFLIAPNSYPSFGGIDNFEEYRKTKRNVLKYSETFFRPFLSTTEANNKTFLDIKYGRFLGTIISRNNILEVFMRIPQTIQFMVIVMLIQSIRFSFLSIIHLIISVADDFFIPALILKHNSVNQFLYYLTLQNYILNPIQIQNPASFIKLVKVKSDQLQYHSIRMEMKNMNFDQLLELKRQKVLSSIKYVISSLPSIEIESAQRFLSMGSELHEIFRLIKESKIQQAVYNFDFSEALKEDVEQIHHIIENCPLELQFLKISIKDFTIKPISFKVERATTLNKFQYTFFQLIEQQSKNNQIGPMEIFIFQTEFLKLDRYNFDYFYFQVEAYLDLTCCHIFFCRFYQIKRIILHMRNLNLVVQDFSLKQNFVSNNLVEIDLICENINLILDGYDASKITNFSIVLKNCFIDIGFLFSMIQDMPQKSSFNLELRYPIYFLMRHCINSEITSDQQQLLEKILGNKQMKFKINQIIKKIQINE